MVQNWISIKICHDLDLWPNNLVQDKCTTFIQMHSFRWSISQIESIGKKRIINIIMVWIMILNIGLLAPWPLTKKLQSWYTSHHISYTQKHFVSEVCEPDLGKEKEYLFQTIDVRQMDERTAEQTDHYRVQK